MPLTVVMLLVLVPVLVLVTMVVVVVVQVVVEANEQAGGLAGWMTRGGSRQRGLGWRKRDEGRGRQEGTKGKRVQAGLGSDEGECVTVCIVGALQCQGRLAFYLPGFALPLPSL